MDYDLAVIGAGWAGFNAAVAAKKKGLKVCLIDRGELGGTCLNRGCIPTKSLLHSAKIYLSAKKAATFGVEIPSLQINFAMMQERKDALVRQLKKGMESMLGGVDWHMGEASFASAEELGVADKRITAKAFLIATGSRPTGLPFLSFDGTKVISSDELLQVTRIPASLLVIGGGVIGCEFASLFSSLGSEVTVVEKMPQLLPGQDRQVAKKLETVFKKKGIKVSIGADAASCEVSRYELVLVAVGRAPYSDGLELAKAGVAVERGRIIVDEYLRTTAPHIFAAGDCTGKVMLAHYAAYQGIVAAENAACPDNPTAALTQHVPNCIFTDPEIASVGVQEEEAQAAGIEVEVHRFDFLGSGMARILDEADGFIKIITEKKSGELRGASLIGPRATELVAGLTIAVTNRLTVSQLRQTIFAHPTISESIHETLA